MKGRRFPLRSTSVHAHVWFFASVPGRVVLCCDSCPALVEVVADASGSDSVVFRFRCLGGTDALVSDTDFRLLAAWFGMLDDGVLYAGRPRSAMAHAAAAADDQADEELSPEVREIVQLLRPDLPLAPAVAAIRRLAGVADDRRASRVSVMLF